MTRHLESIQQTSESRDFLLAIMPQFEEYRVPVNARHMSFGNLFADCCRQLGDNEQVPRLAVFANTTFGQLKYAARDNVPEPKSLGDMAKLLYMQPIAKIINPAMAATLAHPSTRNRPPGSVIFHNLLIYPVLGMVVENITAWPTLLKIVIRSINQSPMYWGMSMLSELEKFPNL